MTPCQEPGDLADLRGTVKPYGRHVLACGGWTAWKQRIEEQEDLLGRMGREVKEAGDRVDPAPKFTALRTESVGDEGIDLLVFPDGLVYRAVTEETWPDILEHHLVGGQPVEALSPEPLEGTHILVCNHGARDPRCGACGPLVATAFEEALERREDTDVHVHRSSHVGGHRFAGNVLVYPGGAWYGYVRPGDVDQVLEAEVDRGERWEAHYRGEMAGPQEARGSAHPK